MTVWRVLVKPRLPFSTCIVFFVSKGNLLDFYVNQIEQDKIFRRKRLSTDANFTYVFIEIWDNGILKFNKFSM